MYFAIVASYINEKLYSSVLNCGWWIQHLQVFQLLYACMYIRVERKDDSSNFKMPVQCTQ